MMVNGAGSLSKSEISQFLAQRYQRLSKQLCDKLAALVMEGHNVNMDTRQPLILCLDKVRQQGLPSAITLTITLLHCYSFVVSISVSMTLEFFSHHNNTRSKK